MFRCEKPARPAFLAPASLYIRPFLQDEPSAEQRWGRFFKNALESSPRRFVHTVVYALPFFSHYFSFQLFDNVPDITLLVYFVRGPCVDKCPEAGLLSREGCEGGKIYIHCPVDGEETPSFMAPKI